MQVVVDWSLEPLRCATCDGTGRVDGTEDYLAQFRPGGVVTFMGGEPHLKPCAVCDGSGRHVSRARAGLAAPPRLLFDIESYGFHPHQVQAVEALMAGRPTEAGLVVVDDVCGPDTPEQRAKVLDWFLRPIPRISP